MLPSEASHAVHNGLKSERMDDLTIARALHVLAIVHWIGALTTVTASILPAARREADPARGAALFEAVEARVSLQVKFSVTLAGLTGFYMTERLDAWARFLDPTFWWMQAMLALWALFMIVLFAAEPFVLDRWFAREATRDPRRVLDLAQRAHWLLTGLAWITVGAAVLGAHRFFL